MVKGLANVDAAAIVVVRDERPFETVDDLWRRAGVPAASLVQLAEADAFQPSLGLARREALWAIKALRDEPLPLFAAASARESRTVAELDEPSVTLRAMTSGSEVVEDYGHVGLTLRSHPLSFLRTDLSKRRIVSCREAMQTPDGKWLEAAGLVLVLQRPGSAKGVMFITIEDETGIIQSGCLGQDLRKLSPRGPRRRHARRLWPDPARRRGCTSGRSPADRSIRRACKRW